MSSNAIVSYRDLTAWQKAMDLTEKVYAETAKLPSRERFGLVAQMRRSAVSVPSNIAEGWGRGKPRISRGTYRSPEARYSNSQHRQRFANGCVWRETGQPSSSVPTKLAASCTVSYAQGQPHADIPLIANR